MGMRASPIRETSPMCARVIRAQQLRCLLLGLLGHEQDSVHGVEALYIAHEKKSNACLLPSVLFHSLVRDEQLDRPKTQKKTKFQMFDSALSRSIYQSNDGHLLRRVGCNFSAKSFQEGKTIPLALLQRLKNHS